MQFSINVSTVFEMELLESSFDLMSNPLFNITKELLMMPTPFVFERCSGHQAKDIPPNYSVLPFYTLNQPLQNHVNSPRRRLQEQRQYQVCRSRPNNPKGKRRIIIANDSDSMK
jgi:hypothetical protein